MLQPILDATATLWLQLAAFAWARHEAIGPGMTLVHHEALVAASAEDPSAVTAWLRYVPRVYVPTADDFHALLSEYDPTREVLLLVGLPEDGETLLRLQSGPGRPTPPECYRTLAEAGDGEEASG